MRESKNLAYVSQLAIARRALARSRLISHLIHRRIESLRGLGLSRTPERS